MGRSDLDRAAEAFVRGFCFTRSMTHPYGFEKIEGVWVTRDGPRKNGRDYRREEWIACGIEPAEVDRIARANTRGHYIICAVLAPGEPEVELRAKYKQLDYRLPATEPVMIHRLQRIPKVEVPVKIELIRTRELAERFSKAWKRKPMKDELLGDDSPVRQYIALDGEKIVGGVGSIDAGAATWVASLYVSPSHRRRGIGKALLARMLRDDRARGSTFSALTASHAGAMLYPVIGYEQVGGLFAFGPRKR